MLHGAARSDKVGRGLRMSRVCLEETKLRLMPVRLVASRMQVVLVAVYVTGHNLIGSFQL